MKTLKKTATKYSEPCGNHVMQDIRWQWFLSNENHIFNVVYMFMWCLKYALRQIMINFISQHHC